jgi:hypothetical protein
VPRLSPAENSLVPRAAFSAVAAARVSVRPIPLAVMTCLPTARLACGVRYPKPMASSPPHIEI